MSANIMNEDLRSVKTEKALYAAMFSLLKRYNFRKITIKKICEEALISRASFYAHFIDRYDLLKSWMERKWPNNFTSEIIYAQLEKEINDNVPEKMAVLKNLVHDADNETFCILYDYILSAMDLTTEKIDDGEIYIKNVVLSNFMAGGAITYLLWHVENKFPSDVPLMNRYLYEIMVEFQDRKSRPIEM